MAEEDAPTTGPSIMRRRVAGIPVVYLAAGGVIILAIVAWRMRTANDAPADNTDVPMDEAQNDTANDEIDSAGYDAFTAKTSITAAPPEKEDPIEVVETNDTWLRKVVEWRVSQGASAGMIQEAIQAYLSGAQLSISQGEERDKAIKQFGLPPDPPDTTSTIGPSSTPAKSQGPLPRGHVVTNGNDDTYAKIAAIYYPSNDTTSVALIANANMTKLVGSGPFKAGTVVWVPKYSVPAYYTSKGKKDDDATEIGKKNGISASRVLTLNPGLKFPVKKGTRVRVG